MDTWIVLLRALATNSRCCLRTMQLATSRRLCNAFPSRSCSMTIVCAVTKACFRPACRRLLLCHTIRENLYGNHRDEAVDSCRKSGDGGDRSCVAEDLDMRYGSSS